MTDKFGDRMKFYEGIEAERILLPMIPICARLDGRSFTRLTRGMERPYDPRFSALMKEVARYLVEESQALMGYTQSDEITLVWYSPKVESQVFFNGRVMKMNSILASMASTFFNNRFPRFFNQMAPMALFDCRVWNVPTLREASNVFLWRELDATKNSISMAARSLYSHKEIQGKRGSEMQEMMFAKGVNWNDYPDFFKRGTFLQRRKVTRRFSAEELEKLPKQHEALRDPELLIERSEIRTLKMPPFSKVINPIGIIFYGEDPIVDRDSA